MPPHLLCRQPEGVVGHQNTQMRIRRRLEVVDQTADLRRTDPAAVLVKEGGPAPGRVDAGNNEIISVNHRRKVSGNKMGPVSPGAVLNLL